MQFIDRGQSARGRDHTSIESLPSVAHKQERPTIRGFLRHRVLLNDASAAADRRNHVDARAGLERCLERAALAVDVDVDVRTQGPTRFAQTIA